MANSSITFSLPYLPSPLNTFAGNAESSTALIPPAKAAIPDSNLPVSWYIPSNTSGAFWANEPIYTPPYIPLRPAAWAPFSIKASVAYLPSPRSAASLVAAEAPALAPNAPKPTPGINAVPTLGNNSPNVSAPYSKASLGPPTSVYDLKRVGYFSSNSARVCAASSICRLA